MASDIHKLSKSQIDRLGERLRKGAVSETDLQLLSTYRLTFDAAYDKVIRAIRSNVGLEPTGRPAKSTTSITEKLRRESIRLSQIQDIAGCRLVVVDIAEQHRVVDRLRQQFDQADVVDRRKHPSNGYRAVHIIVTLEGKLIEIQVRTSLQQLWAEYSEKFSDVTDPAIKYGGGDEAIRSHLSHASALVAEVELVEQRLVSVLAHAPPVDAFPDDLKVQIRETGEQISNQRRKVAELLQKFIAQIKNFGEGENDLSD